ncbi:septum formation initiator [Corynebacterium incognita]|uniref:Septum formation initiator n=1 Tax=Corynebacterium incognita TaxID=2754725 RepID=A0A7G7CMF8_9CORY|nr:septum formation initiator [Corynebacterium incognita]QNE88774.1 septum formation initiator [Corynebacterium incognita]
MNHNLLTTNSPEGLVLIAVNNTALHAEAEHAAAATGCALVSATDPRLIARHAAQATAVIADAQTAPQLSALAHRHDVFVVAPEPGAGVSFVLPAQSRELLAALGAALRGPEETAPGRGRGRIIAVTGAGGGVGTTTVAAALVATVAEREGGALFVDAVADSGGADLIFGLEDHPGARWPDIQADGGLLDAGDVRAAVPTTTGGVSVLTCERSNIATDALSRTVLDTVLNGARAGEGTTVVDCLRHEIPEQADFVAVVTAAQVRPVGCAAATLAKLRQRGTPAGIILRHRDWSGLEAADVERMTRSDVLAEVGTVARLARAGELGGLPARLPKPLRTACAAILAEAGEPR